MTRSICMTAIALSLAIQAAYAREMGAIKKFLQPFPIPTYELNGQLSDKVIDSSAPPVSEISVDGLWPDKKMLLISFASKPEEGYFILYRAVEMNDQVQWNYRMAATGGPRCLPTAAGQTHTITAGTNAFINPC